MRRFTFVALIFASLLPHVAAADFNEALQWFETGGFSVAIDKAAGLGTADGYALAARAALSVASYGDDPDRQNRALDQALRFTSLARQADPEHVEAMLQRAIALGYLARTEGHFRAYRKGRAEAALALIEKALSLAPDNGWAHALLGGWHAEIEAEGGFLGNLIFRVKKEDAIEPYEKALALLPGNPVVRLEFAKALLRMNSKEYAGRAALLLGESIALPPQNYVDVLAQRRARHLRTLVESNPARLDDLLRQMEPFLE